MGAVSHRTTQNTEHHVWTRQGRKGQGKGKVPLQPCWTPVPGGSDPPSAQQLPPRHLLQRPPTPSPPQCHREPTRLGLARTTRPLLPLTRTPRSCCSTRRAATTSWR